jgi:hypothetical protein
MLVITGMSDNDWTKTMKEGMLDALHPTIHHRGELRSMDTLESMRNGIIITDECHVACQIDQTIDKKLNSAGLKSIETLKRRNMRMLDVSATPESVLHDLTRWKEYTEIVVLKPDIKYKGFQSMIDESRLRNAKDFDLDKLEDAERLIKIFDDRYKASKTKKYFAFRLGQSSTARDNIRDACKKFGWEDPVNHDSQERVQNIDAQMGTAPPKHTVFFVKGFWRASKRLVRQHAGGTYEAPTIRPDDTSKSQGLTARFCSTFDWEGEQQTVDLRPLHFDDLDSIRRYQGWWRAGTDYTQAAYSAPRMRSNGKGKVNAPMSKVHHEGIEGVDVIEEVPKAPSAPSFKLSLQTFDSVESAKSWWKNPESVATEPHDVRFGIAQYKIYQKPEGVCIKYRSGFRRIISETSIRSGRTEVTDGYPPVVVGQDLGREGVGVARILPVFAQDLQWGIASSARVMPVNAGPAIKYIVIYKPDAVYTPRASGSVDTGSVGTLE